MKELRKDVYHGTVKVLYTIRKTIRLVNEELETTFLNLYKHWKATRNVG